jgi:AhpD family alkylhydroperoxidase
MSTINISRYMQQTIVTIVIFAVCGIIFASGDGKAAGTTSSEAAMTEMKEMLGGVPTELQLYPESARAAGWAMMKSTDLNENTALPSKVRELIGLAVAAQIPCQYCVYYHIKAAKAAGASQEEIREAVHQASLTRHWSTILYGNQYDLDAYKAEIDAAFK